MPRLIIHIVRHGETQENRTGILQGQLDTELNEQGIDQARLVADALKDVPFSAAFSSDLKRAKLTAETILESHPGVELQECKELRERFMGVYQGTKVTKDMKWRLQEDTTVESREELKSRGFDWWQSTILPLASNAQHSSPLHVLVVSHGGLITTKLHKLLEDGHLVSDKYGIPLARCLNTAIATVEVNEPQQPAVLRKYGDIAHLLKPKVKQSVVEDNVDEVEIDSKVDSGRNS